MHTCLQIIPSDCNWHATDRFVEGLLSFLGVEHVKKLYEVGAPLNDDLKTAASGERASVAVLGEPPHLLWSEDDISSEGAIELVQDVFGRWKAEEQRQLVLLPQHNDAGLCAQLYRSLLSTVDPATHDNWSPWRCSLVFGQHVVRGEGVLDVGLDDGSSFSIIRFREVGKGGYITTVSPASISICGDGCPTDCERYLEAAAGDPVLRLLLQWLGKATDMGWRCYLMIT